MSLPDLWAFIRWNIFARWHLPNVQMLEDSPSDKTVLLQVGDRRIWWPRDYDPSVLPQVWAEVFVDYPPNGHQYVHRGSCLRENDFVVDVGASEGFFTQLALEFGCQVLAIEPLSRFQTTLRKTFAEAIEDERLHIAGCALGARDGSGRLEATGSAIGAKLKESSGTETQETRDSSTCNATQIRTLDGVLSDFGVAHVDFVKMDIEGYEPAALLGARRTICEERPRLALACYHEPREPRELANIVEGFGVGYQLETQGCTRMGRHFVPQVLHAWTQPHAGAV